jgi:hypothetical protein
MWRYLICHSLLWLLPLSARTQGTDLFLQNPGNELEVFPVRVNHKTGYAKFFNNKGSSLAYVLVEPRYDYIMEDYLPYHGGDLTRPVFSPFRLFEIDGKVGILNRALKEVLPARYNQIRILGDHLFALEENDKEGFALSDTAGRYLLGAERFEDIHTGGEALANTSPRFIFFKKNGRWGVCRLSGEVIIPPTFTEIRPAGLSGCFKVRTIAGKGLWQAVDSTGTLLIQQALEDLTLLGKNMFLGFDGIAWQRLYPEGKGSFRMGSERFLHVEILSSSMAVLVSQVDDFRFAAALWRVHERPSELKRIILEPANGIAIHELIAELKKGNTSAGQEWFFPLEENLIFQKLAGNGIALIDAEGRENSLEYRWIQTSGFPGIYKIWNTNFGLYDQASSKVLLPPSFLSISNFNGRLATAQGRGVTHLLGIADTGLVQYPVQARRALLQDGNRATLQLSSTSITVSFSSDGTFQEDAVQTRLMRVSANADRPFIEAPTVEKIPLLPYRGIPHKTSPVMLRKENSSWVLFKPPGKEEQRSGNTREIWKVQLPASDALWKGEEVIHNKLAALFYRTAKYQSPLLPSYRNQQSVVRLYDLENQKFVGDSTILGFRRFDSLYQFTAFIDKNGQMGLIDRSGQEVLDNEQPLRYTYIGPFVAGRARVALGGKLTLNYPNPLDVPYKFQIARHEQFLEDFQALPRQNLHTIIGQAGVFVASTPESEARWGYIDTIGRLLFVSHADYVTDYHIDSTAFFLKRNMRQAFGRPDADYGLLNYQGEPICPANYSNITRLNGVLIVEVDSTPTFYFTPKGVELFVNPTRLRPFSEGLAQFMDPETNLWGYLDTSGHMAIPPTFRYARSFSEGRAIVGNSEGFMAVIDHDGREVFHTNIPIRMHSFIGDYKNGRCWFKAASGWLWGCYDRNGNVAIEPKYYHLLKKPSGSSTAGYEYNPLPMDFFAGSSIACTEANNKIQFYLVDSLGKVMSALKDLQQVENFQPSGFAIFKDAHQKQGIVNFRGEIIVPPQYTQIRPFEEGFAAVKSEQGKWGLVDTLGRLVLNAHYSALDALSAGLVKVKYPNNPLWYYLDTTGHQVFPVGFEQAGMFKDNVTLVKNGKIMQIMNREGAIIDTGTSIPREFSEGIFCMEETRGNVKMSYFADASGNNKFGRYFAEITPFQQGVAGFKVWIGERRKSNFGAVNSRGVVIVPPKYRKLHVQPDGSIITNPQRFYGLMDNKGRLLIPPDYDRIERYEDSTLFRLERGESLGYIKISGASVDWLWDLQK